jgi:hypothetical protein
MYIRGLLFPLANTIKKTKRVGLEKSGHHHRFYVSSADEL